MVHSFQRGWRPGRVTSFVVGALLVGGLLLAAVPTRSAETPAKKEPTKKEVKRTLPPPPWPRPLDLVIAGKDQQHNAEVADTVKFINQQLEATWKADKVVPSLRRRPRVHPPRQPRHHWPHRHAEGNRTVP